MPLYNNGDVDFTMELQVGGQGVRVIPDTGSFTLVLFSDLCESCGKRKSLLHPKQVKNFKTGHERAVQNYGSGDTYSADAYAPLRLQCQSGKKSGPESIRTSAQMFWMTVKANLPVAEESSFQGILGLGPPSSDVKMAELQAEEAEREVHRMKLEGLDTDQYKPLVDNLKEIARFTATVKPWLENINLTFFSVCLRSGFGQEGTLIYNDQQVLTHPGLFTSIPVDKNGPYWQTTLSAVTLGSSKDYDRIQTTGTTLAILDTGTSLIGAPQWFVRETVAFVSARLEELGCDDVSKWPDLNFKLGDVALALPASSYLGSIIEHDNFMDDEPHLYYSRMPQLKNSTRCTALLFSTTNEEEDEEHKEDLYIEEEHSNTDRDLGHADSPEWIFGLPFFRTYYTTFMLGPNSKAARQMFLAEANSNCEVQGKPGSDSTVEEAVRLPSRERLVGPMAVDPRKLRFPSRDASKKKRSKTLQAAKVFAEG